MLFILDTEISSAMKNKFDLNEVKCQLVPPDQHHRNVTERAIREFKNRLLAGLAIYDPSYPVRK